MRLENSQRRALAEILCSDYGLLMEENARMREKLQRDVEEIPSMLKSELLKAGWTNDPGSDVWKHPSLGDNPYQWFAAAVYCIRQIGNNLSQPAQSPAPPAPQEYPFYPARPEYLQDPAKDQPRSEDAQDNQQGGKPTPLQIEQAEERLNRTLWQIQDCEARLAQVEAGSNEATELNQMLNAMRLARGKEIDQLRSMGQSIDDVSKATELPTNLLYRLWEEHILRIHPGVRDMKELEQTNPELKFSNGG